MFVNTLRLLKACLRTFRRKNTEIKRAAIVQAVVIFSIPKMEWPKEGSLFEWDSNKYWGGGGKMGPLFELSPGHC